jgi:hypothetical protein
VGSSRLACLRALPPFLKGAGLFVKGQTCLHPFFSPSLTGLLLIISAADRSWAYNVQVLCGDVGIARELFSDSENEAERRKGSGTQASDSGGWTQPDVAFFFISYTLINAVMMMNVVVAVLCDEFVQQVTRAQEEEERLELLEQDKRKVKGCLDMMTKAFITFEDMQDLESKINHLYEQLDEDGSGKSPGCQQYPRLCCS